MKKILFSALILSLLLAILTACGAEAKQATEPEPTPKIEQSEPVAKPEPLAAPEKTEISQEELEPIFEQVYTEASETHPEDWSIDFQITDEIGKITKAIPDDKKAPANLREIYIEWRAAKTEPEPTAEPEPKSAPENDFSFTDADEMMYTTGTVNIRTGPGTSYDKIDSLPKAWSVHRIGIGTGTAEGWSLIEFEDGSTACVSSNYLSYTKPSTQAVNNNGGSTGGSSGSSGGKQQGTTSGSSSSDDWGFNPNAGRSEEDLQKGLEDSYNTEFRVNGT